MPNGGEYCLQPAFSPAPIAAQQLADFRIGDQHHRLIVQWEADSTGMRVAGLTPLGQTLFQTQYSAQGLQTRGVVDARMRPDLLLALLQLAHWPAAAVQAGLPASLRVEDSATRRTLRSGVRTVLTVEREGAGPLYRRLQIEGLGWEITVTPLD